MNELESMRIFVRVAELKSFTKVAQQLQLPNSTVSTAVQYLENKLRARLLHRTTRKVHLTQDGIVFYERCKGVLIEFESLQTMFQHQPEQLRGRLRVDMPIRFARKVVIPRLHEFLEAHPLLQIELGSTDRRVDLIHEGFDCVVRIGTLTDSALIARLLGHFTMVNCASQSYVDTYGMPNSLEDLAHHKLIHYDPTFSAKGYGWEWFDGQQTHTVPMSGAITVNNTESYESACKHGLGIIQVPEAGVRHLLQQGVLVKLLPDYAAKPMPISLLYANRHHLSPRLQAFMAWLAKIVQSYIALP